MNRNTSFLRGILILLATVSVAGPRSSRASAPNIVYVIADDLGYGDVQCLNPRRGRIPTPNIDRLAREGMTFTDAHGGSSVCTPTRYGILTGRYAWRTRLQKGVLSGYEEPLIAPGRLTVPALLKRHGYHSACIGKWHLGFTVSDKGAGRRTKGDLSGAFPGARTGDGPLSRGFDHFFGFHHARMMKSVFLDDRVTELVEPVDMLPRLARHAAEYVLARARGADTPVRAKGIPARSGRGAASTAGETGVSAPRGGLRTSNTEGWAAATSNPQHPTPNSQSGGPFFLYLALNSPHTPIVPSKEWQGRSGLGDYGDFVMETDWALGEVLAALEASGVASNTLVIFTSDNGCSPAAGIDKLEKQGHFPSAQFRGAKADIWDGGHRIPLVARWPGVVKPGAVCGRLVCLTDLMATCAEIVGATLPADAGEDSVSFLPALRGEGSAGHRTAVVHHSINGMFAIRDGSWKLALCPGSGGWGAPRDAEAAKQGLPAAQLYDLSVDIGETNNLAVARPEVVARLKARLEAIVTDGRSTPGAARTNDVAVLLWKKGDSAAAGAPD